VELWLLTRGMLMSLKFSKLAFLDGKHQGYLNRDSAGVQEGAFDILPLSLYYIEGGTDASSVTTTGGSPGTTTEDVTAVVNQGTASGDTFTNAALYFGNGPVLQASNGFHYFQSTPANDGRLETTRSAAALTADLFLVIRIPPGSDLSETLISGGASVYAQNGSTSNASNITGLRNVTVDQGSDLTTRGELWTALEDNDWHVVRVKSGVWDSYTLMIHAAGSTNTLVDTAAVAIIKSTDVAANEANIEAHFNAIAATLNGA
jgi:hypothetical protein